MLRVVAMLETDMAWDAEVKVITSGASDKAGFRELYHISLACC
jgi:hypothetical protein